MGDGAGDEHFRNTVAFTLWETKIAVENRHV
jgi:hypothetical protein